MWRERRVVNELCFIFVVARMLTVIKWQKEERQREIILHSYSNKLIWFSEFELHIQIHIDWLHCKTFAMQYSKRASVRTTMSSGTIISRGVDWVCVIKCMVSSAQWYLFCWFLISTKHFEIRSSAQIKQHQNRIQVSEQNELRTTKARRSRTK